MNTFELPQLTEEESKESAILAKMYRAMIHAFRDSSEPAYAASSGKNEDPNDNLGYFRAIPLDCHIVPILKQVRKAFTISAPTFEHPTLLDVGCGKGNILAAANVCSFRATGIEVRNHYTAKYRPWHSTMVTMDAFDFKDYDEYDVIYFFRPIKDREKMEKLCKLIMDKVKKDSIVIPVGCSEYFDKDKRFARCLINSSELFKRL